MNRKQQYSFVVALVCIILMAIMVIGVSITASADSNPPKQEKFEPQYVQGSVSEVLVGIPDRAVPETTPKAEESTQNVEPEMSKSTADAVEELIEEAQRKTVSDISMAEEAEEAEADVSPTTPEADYSEPDAEEETYEEPTYSAEENYEEPTYSEEENEDPIYSVEDDGEVAVEEFYWDGPVLNSYVGVVEGPSGKETYYNLPMDWVVSYMRYLGYDEENYPYYVREDGCKMLGDYIMVAANLDLRPRGTIVKTSLGWGIVADTGGFAEYNHTQLDIAVNW